MINGLAIYPRGGKLYMFHIQNVNGDTGMVYFSKQVVYRIKIVDNKLIATKVMMTEPPLAFKYGRLPLFNITNNIQAPGIVLGNPEVQNWILSNQSRYDLNENKINSIKIAIREIIKSIL